MHSLSTKRARGEDVRNISDDEFRMITSYFLKYLSFSLNNTAGRSRKSNGSYINRGKLQVATFFKDTLVR